MIRHLDAERRDSGWRGLALAGGAAVAVTALLVVVVGLIWALGRSPASSALLPALDSSTPTPRALSFTRPTPTLADPAEVSDADGAAGEADPGASLTATPPLLAMTAEETPATTDNGTVFEASGEVALTSLASGSWTVMDDTLVNEGTTAVAEPWLPLATVPGPAFAVEAEIRMTELLSSVCDQSFGLTGGSMEASQLFGAGLLFPCGATEPRARLTDVTDWANGYNADPVIAEEDVDPDFDPGADWHTYRFELRGDTLRLLVDGLGVVSGEAPAPIDPAAADVAAGIWAQGVGLEVRRVAIHPLPAS
jgi:hypothetical protein